MDPSPVDRVYEDFQAAEKLFGERVEPSLQNRIDELFKKAILLSAASWFEYLIVQGIVDTAAEFSNRSSAIVSFVRNKGIARQYHTFFQWDRKNAAGFFGLFGTEFAAFMQNKVSVTPELEEAIRAFLELGDDRNRMVHGNYAAFVLDKTTPEIYALYKRAAPFAEHFSEHLKSFCRAEAQTQSTG